MNEIRCPECGCIVHLEWKTPEEIKEQSLPEKTEKALRENKGDVNK